MQTTGRARRPGLLAWLLLVGALALGGCAALPAQVDRPVSHARVDARDTSLGKIAAASIPAADPALSGFRLLPDGEEAFAARLALIRRAEKTIDVQYYLIAADATGRRFLDELADAAARGVRVRVLVDDLSATGSDARFAALARQPQLEVRLFNPLPVRGGSFARRLALSLHDLPRINHRMHNKLFIADDTFAVTGGRNIGDEYFGRGRATHFIDMDLLSSGPVVAELSALFDQFWNSPYVYPVDSLVRSRSHQGEAPEAPATAAVPAELSPRDDDAGSSGTIAAELARGAVAQRFALARLLADPPSAIVNNDPGRGDSAVMRAHLDLLASARTSVTVATPYFVPGTDNLDALRQARARGVRFTVMTNSLATTDEPLVHFGYARYRLGLLRLGVALHELMPMPEAAAGPGADDDDEQHGASLGRLHAKLVVVDDRWLAIGSMNMDRRSARANTEAAIVIDDAELAREVAGFLERGRRSASYALRLDDKGERVEWVGASGDAVVRDEPRPRSGPGLKLRLASFFVSEELL